MLCHYLASFYFPIYVGYSPSFEKNYEHLFFVQEETASSAKPKKMRQTKKTKKFKKITK